MVSREPACVLLGPFYGTAGGRQFPRNFQVYRPLHRPYGITATFSVPFLFFICWNKSGSSLNRISPVMKSLADTSPREMALRASRMNRGVWWKLDLIVISE